MQKILTIFVILPTFVYAAYNPFFNDIQTTIQKQETVKIKEVVTKPIPDRKNAKITYFGFVESTKGKFALVSFNDQNIVIQKNDSLYLDEQIFKVYKITTNYILFKDRYERTQMVYFSSDNESR